MLLDSTPKPAALEQELDAPLRWELDVAQAGDRARRLIAEQNQAGQAAMMRMMSPGRR